MQQDVSEWLVDEFMLLMWCYLLRGMSCSPYQPFVVVLFFKSNIVLTLMLFMLKQKHYTLTKVRNVKS